MTSRLSTVTLADIFRWLCVVLYAVGGLLPIVGLIGLWREAKKSVPSADQPTLESSVETFENTGEGEEFSAAVRGLTQRADAAPRIELRRAGRDLWLVGIGVASATAASVTSLFISTS